MTTLFLGRICRTCLLESPLMHKLLDVKRDCLQIDEMLYKIIPDMDFSLDHNVEDDIPLPVEICNECWEKLQIAYDFQKLCRDSNNYLKRFFSNGYRNMDGISVEDPTKDTINVKDCNQDETEIADIIEIDQNYNDETIKAEDFSELLCAEDIKDNEEIIEKEVTEYHEFEPDDYENDSNPVEEYWPNNETNNSDCNNSEPVKKPLQKKLKKRKFFTEDKSKTCPNCHQIFAKRMFLTRHLSVHCRENKFECDICQYRYATEKLLKIHISYKHKGGVNISLAGGPYQCPDCPMIFEQTRALAAHRVMHLERDFKCQICGINLKTLAAVTRHMNCKHPGVLPYKCEICEQAFPVETHYNDHVNMHKGFKKHKCEMCDKSFPNITALNDHMRSHTGESPYLCSHCGKSFKTANILRQHLQRHGEKNFQCPECPMRFYVKVNLQKHMCTHSKEKPYVCDICGSSFTRGDSLKAHKFKHSGERPFKCEECSMSFVFKRHLMRHKITHTGEKPHMCSYCDRSYAASGDLVKHLRTHLGEKTYFCDECPESFKYQHDLRDHKNQHYKNKTDNGNAEKKQKTMLEC